MEPVNIFAIAASPRAGGNSSRLLDEAVAGAASAGARVTKADLRQYRIAGCIECGGCEKTGRCVVQDDFQEFYPRIISTDRIILASPVFFMGLAAQAKALIDRCQALWVRKYKLKTRIPGREGVPRRGYLIATGGSGLPGTFDCPKKETTFFFKTIDMEFAGDVSVNGLNDKGDIEKHPEEIRRAFDLGVEAARP